MSVTSRVIWTCLCALMVGASFTAQERTIPTGAVPIPQFPPNEFGRYEGSVVASWNRDGRQMTLTEPFRYVDPAGRTWDAPTGAVVDGASIPKFFWNTIGGPFEGNYRQASVIHDVYCVTKSRQWEDVHRTFYYAMRASGVSRTQAKIMYAAVYHFGPRWPVVQGTTTCRTTNGKEECHTSNMILPPRPYTVQENNFPELERLIREKDDSSPLDPSGEFRSLSLEDIERFTARPR